jgi:hypothetical protein
MSDNAASHDSDHSEVHPDTRAGADNDQQDDGIKEDAETLLQSVAEADAPAVEESEKEEETEEVTAPKPPSASPPPAPPPAQSPSPTPEHIAVDPEQAPISAIIEEIATNTVPEENNETNAQNEEPLFMGTTDAGEEGEGFDPDTLANLAALSRLQGDGDDEDEDGDQEGSGGDHDFSSLAVDPQQMTREQMHEIVARLAQGDDQDGDGDEDPDADAEGEEEFPEDGQDGVQHKREDSEDLREVDDSQKDTKDESDGSKAGRRKRKRNRTVL